MTFKVIRNKKNNNNMLKSLPVICNRNAESGDGRNSVTSRSWLQTRFAKTVRNEYSV